MGGEAYQPKSGMTSLTSLSLSDNKELTGSIPTEILRLQQLEVLDISYTPKLESALPSNLLEAMPQLQSISIRDSGVTTTCSDISASSGLQCCDDSSSEED